MKPSPEGQPEPVCLLAHRDSSHGATNISQRKEKMIKRDGDLSKVVQAINLVHLTTKRTSSLDWNDSRETFRWIRSVHSEYSSGGSIDHYGIDQDSEGLYLKVSQLQRIEFVIWPDKHDMKNNSNWEFRGGLMLECGVSVMIWMNVKEGNFNVWKRAYRVKDIGWKSKKISWSQGGWS